MLNVHFPSAVDGYLDKSGSDSASSLGLWDLPESREPAIASQLDALNDGVNPFDTSHFLPPLVATYTATVSPYSNKRRPWYSSSHLDHLCVVSARLSISPPRAPLPVYNSRRLRASDAEALTDPSLPELKKLHCTSVGLKSKHHPPCPCQWKSWTPLSGLSTKVVEKLYVSDLSMECRSN